MGLLTGLGHLLEHTQRPDEAEALERRGLGILEDLAAKHVDDQVYRAKLVNNLSALGRRLRMTGRPKQADEAYRRCVAVVEVLLKANSKDPTTRAAASGMSMGWALVQWDLGHLDDAEANVQHAIALNESLVTDYPAMPSYRVSLAHALADLANLLEDRGQPAEAEQAFDRARSILNTLIVEFPDPFPYRTELSSLVQRRRISKGFSIGLQALERFVAKSNPLLRNQPMWPIISALSTLATHRPGAIRVRQLALESLETRQLLSAAEFELSSLLPAKGGGGTKGFVVNGIADHGKLGSPFYGYHSVGDVNQDGVDDILIAATGAASDPAIIAHVYIIFGRPGGFPAELDLHTLDGTTGYRIDGIVAGDRAGLGGGGVGDVNRDGVPDVAILANGQTAAGDNLTGDQTFVVYGGTTHLALLDQADGAQDGRIGLSAIDGSHGFVINGIPAPGMVGSRMYTRINGACDVNGDHVDDLIVGAYQTADSAPYGAGKAFVIFGRDSTLGHVFPGVFELSSLDGSNGFVIPGLAEGNELGISVGGGGDVNGDGVRDLVLGAMMASPTGRIAAGQVYVIFGRASFPATFNLASLNGSNGFTVNGGAATDYLGGYTADVAGDVNGDGVDDVLIAGWGVDDFDRDSAGAAYIVFGKNSGIAGPFPAVLDVSTLTGSNGFVMNGVAANDATARANRAGDVNGDGYDDVLIGSINADPNGLTSAGQSYVVYGRASFGASLDLASLLAANGGDGSAGFALNGYGASGNAGWVAGVGDLNADGFADVRVGATTLDLSGLTEAGQAYIIYGKPSPPPPATKFYVVNDASTDRTYEYIGSGSVVENYTLGSANTAPRGAASTAAGDKVWVADANKKVYVYNPGGDLLGSWTAGTLASNAIVEGITTNGTDVWIVDAQQDKVFRYIGAASRVSGSQNAASSFNLNSSNTSPKDIVTEGVNLWVVNDSSTDKVFKYTQSGSLVGSWTITGAGSSPTGLTLDPTNVSNLWIVDSGTDRVYQYDNAAGRLSGTQAPSTYFGLAAGNTNPQGIADPPAPTHGVSRATASHPTGALAALRPRPLTVASPSIPSPKVASNAILWTPLTDQDFTLLATELVRPAPKRPRTPAHPLD